MNSKDIYHVLSAVLPLYVPMFLAYASVKRWKLFTAEQCFGFSRFVAFFAFPFLGFHFISRVNPATLHLRFLAADCLSKVTILLLLFAWSVLFKAGSLDWSITTFSLAALPNTMITGMPLLKSMYGDEQEGLIIQMVLTQAVVWNILLLLLFEYRAARNAVKAAQKDEENDKEDKLEEGEKEGELGGLEDSVVGNGREDDSTGRGGGGGEERSHIGRYSVIKQITRMVCVKLMSNPNFYASILGVLWALSSFRWNVRTPELMKNSVSILSNVGLGAATFSLGLFMAMQPTIIPCGKRHLAYGMLTRFIVGPAVMGLASLAVGLRGTVLKVSLMQAALPQGFLPFVFAREYDLHPEILSTMFIFGMIAALPITMLYYVLLGL